jgi:hypothetical protein
MKHRRIVKYIKILVLKNCGYHKIRSGCAELVTQCLERGRILGEGQTV